MIKDTINTSNVPGFHDFSFNYSYPYKEHKENQVTGLTLFKIKINSRKF